LEDITVVWLTSCVFGARPSMWGFRLLGRRKEMIFFSCDESLKTNVDRDKCNQPLFLRYLRSNLSGIPHVLFPKSQDCFPHKTDTLFYSVVCGAGKG